MTQLRLPPSGPQIVGDNVGDVLIWDGNEWLPGPPGPGGESAWDHIVTELADLPTPVADVITLTSGSWAFKASIDLGPNTINIPAGVTVLLKGMGGFNQKVLSSEATRVIILEGSAYMESLTLDAENGSALEMTNAASLVSQACVFDGDAQGITMSAGLWRDSLSRVTGGDQAMVMTGGTLNLSQTRFNPGTGIGIDFSGADVADVFLQGVRVSPSEAAAISWDCPSGHLYAVDTELVCGSAAPCVLVAVGLGLQFVGGRWSGDGGIGLEVNGNITRHLQVVGVQGAGLSDFVQRTAGTVRQATIQGCSTFSDVAIGVSWASASAPTNGLLLVGNNFDTATPISGFTAASARVNLKACTSAGALMAETAIVP